MWETGDLILFILQFVVFWLSVGWWCWPGAERVYLGPAEIMYMSEGPIEIIIGEYLVHAWLDLVTKLQKYTPFAYSWPTSVKRKK